MLIGTQYADNKLYRGIKHYDKMPLTSGDIHEYSDTEYMKNAYIMNNLLGYGTLNSPVFNVTSGGISLADPSVVMIDGDISLIQSDDNVPIVSKADVVTAGYDKGLICIVGWYQAITAGSTMRNYGGVDNSILPNDLLNTDANLQYSSRFQFRWFPILMDKDDYAVDNITIEITDRDIKGDKLATTTTLVSLRRENNVFIMQKPSSMSYAESDIYVVPIGSYWYDGTDITKADASDKLGIVSNISVLQYESSYVMPDEHYTASDITVPINITQLTEEDVFSVSYESLLLYKGTHYTIDYAHNTITLLGFTSSPGDIVHFSVTKLVNTGNVSDMNAILTRHIQSYASDTVLGHVNLIDELNTYDIHDGFAATPKMVSDVKTVAEAYTDTKVASANSYTNTQLRKTKSDLETTIDNVRAYLQAEITSGGNIQDDVTHVNYRFGMSDGKLYIEEV